MTRLRFFHDKRAVSPVLSNLLLMVVAVAAMALATTSTYVITTNMRETMSERIALEDLWFNNSTSSIDAYLRNVGMVTVHVSTVYVNGTPQFFPSPFDLEVGGYGWLNIPYSWTVGSLYRIDIVTSRGTHVGGYYKAS